MRSFQTQGASAGIATWTAAALLCVAAATGVAAQPTVNGQFYGDGDDAYYVHWDTSYYGSRLYVYFDAPTTTLYVALVVDRSVNDNVFGASHSGYSGNYMQTAGWGKGKGQQRSAADLVNSEFATFEFACAPGSPNSWAWQQGYACQNGSSWSSDSTCGTSAVLMNGYPPSLQSASSFAWNINTWNAAGTKPWNLHVFGTNVGSWKSPFETSDPNTDPPNNPNTVIGLDGYPAPTNTGDLSLGPAITHSTDHEYEWSMIWEWSINVGGDGTTTGAGCGSNQLFLITGASHHSPMKDGVAGMYDTECGEENDCFPPNDGDQDPLSDFGDLPDTYGTLIATGGAQHPILATGPYLGATVQIELDGQPSSGATDDGTEEDGVVRNVDSNWTAGSTQTLDVEVGNAPSGALLGGWFDWNNDGDFSDAGEFFSWTVSEGSNSLSVTVGSGYDWQHDDLYARFRIFSDASAAPGGSLEQADSLGLAADGEVEDYFYPAGTNPVTLNAFASEDAGGGALTVRWQTASETDNVAFELWGRVGGDWQALGDLVASRNMNSGVPQSYETRVEAPAGLTALRLVDYDSRGRGESFGPFAVGGSYGEHQPVREIDWSAPRAERAERLRQRGFEDTAGAAPRGLAVAALATERPATARWKKLRRGTPVTAPELGTGQVASISVATSSSRSGSAAGGTDDVEIAGGPLTHVAVTDAGVQRVTYEALRDGGLDLAGVPAGSVAVSWRGEPVARWIDGAGKFGPGSAIEFVGHPPWGDDALYMEANLYQVSADRSLVREARTLGQGRARNVSPSYLRQTLVDRPLRHYHQSPTGDPWVERIVLARRGRTSTVTLEVPVDGPVADGPAELVVGLGSVTDLPDLVDDSGAPLPEHNVEVWWIGPGSAPRYVTSSSLSGQQEWTLEAPLPGDALEPGLHRIELRFTTDYLFSLSVVDRYGLRYPSPYRGPSLDFAPDPNADGYRVEGFEGPDAVAYAEGGDGALTRIDLRTQRDREGYAAELRTLPPGDAERIWVTAAPHAPPVFTTEAPADLLAGPADLVVIAGSSFVGTPALDDYLQQRSDLDPVVIDVEDVYNAVGFGMALPSAITDYLRARDAVFPFTHVQLVGTDCYDRLNHVSQCLSFLPLPTAPVHVSRFAPSQNRLVDLDGDGVGDKAVAQFSVRDAGELATLVAKATDWSASGLASEESALLIAEETDGTHDFRAQIGRVEEALGWDGAEVLDLADHPDIRTARSALRSSLEDGRAVTVFSGHSSPAVWAFRNLLNAGSAAQLTNDGRPTLMVPLACETTYDVSPNANVLGHQLLYAGDRGAVAITGPVALSTPRDNERMGALVLDGLKQGLTVGEAVLRARRSVGTGNLELQDNWLTQGDVALRMER